MLFGSGLIIERDPLALADLPAALASWVRDAGLIAAVCLAVWATVSLVLWLLGVGSYPSRRYGPPTARNRSWLRSRLFLAAACGAAAFYIATFLLLLLQAPPRAAPAAVGAGLQRQSAAAGTALTREQQWCLTIGGALALAAVLLPLLLDLFGRLRWRRIWALARLSIKEARSKGILWVALIIPFIYLYADWYLIPPRDEDQLSQRVKVVYFSLTLLFVVSAMLLGSFNIPTDVKNQTIHTIVTKPVERYEIVLGRFVGYALLLLVEVVALTALSLFYVQRGLTPQAIEESYHARVPLLADEMTFYRTKGESAGREWDYRKYISGIGMQVGSPRPYVVWRFRDLPARLAEASEPVAVQFSFDIYRTTKGNEKVQGVYCSFTLADGRWDVDKVEEEVSRVDKERDPLVAAVNQKWPALQLDQLLKRMNEAEARKAVRERDELRKQKFAEIHESLAAKHGLHVERGVVVVDYHTQTLKVPAGLFKKLYADHQGAAKGGGAAPAMQILVGLELNSGPQLLGAARRDLFVLEGDNPFWLNFLKGAVGLWFVACLVLGIALACSTYLSAVISLLATAFLCGAGLFQEYIRSLAAGTSVGGGPFESMHRLANRQGMVVQLDQTSAVVNVLQGLDAAYRWYLTLVLKLIPDVTRYDLTTYVASGFDISWTQILLADTLLPLLGYLIPCGVLAYYLMNSREIANPT